LFDRRCLTELRELQIEGEPDILAEVVQVFLNSTPVRLSDLQQAITQNDAAAVKDLAHALKGSSGTLGARQMAELCLQLEMTGRSGDLGQSEALWLKLEEEFTRVRAVLEAELQNNQG
jgi:HPt (histidine-containing phosphotransfer) domain-containing protein